MKYLFDTHIIIWTLEDDKRLSQKVKDIIANNNDQIYYSVISPWETEIKHLKHKNFNLSGKQMTTMCDCNGMFCLPIEAEHVEELKNLNKPEDVAHNDPFDRMLLAQAKAEKMILITHDKKFKAYDEKCLMIV